MDPERARTYLERYFADEQINIYWGSSDRFIRELWTRWQARHGTPPVADARVPVGATA